jgi:hypothetical protein
MHPYMYLGLSFPSVGVVPVGDSLLSGLSAVVWEL